MVRARSRRSSAVVPGEAELTSILGVAVGVPSVTARPSDGTFAHKSPCAFWPSVQPAGTCSLSECSALTDAGGMGHGQLFEDGLELLTEEAVSRPCRAAVDRMVGALVRHTPAVFPVPFCLAGRDVVVRVPTGRTSTPRSGARWSPWVSTSSTMPDLGGASSSWAWPRSSARTRSHNCDLSPQQIGGRAAPVGWSGSEPRSFQVDAHGFPRPDDLRPNRQLDHLERVRSLSSRSGWSPNDLSS